MELLCTGVYELQQVYKRDADGGCNNIFSHKIYQNS